MRLRTATLAWVVLAVGVTCKVRIPAGETVDGEFPCETSDTCPAPDHGCLVTTCLDGQCVFIPAPNGVLPEEEQVIGDCKELYCSGDGEVISYAAQHDLPRRDGNSCTTSSCDVDMPKHEPKVAGTRCPLSAGGEGLCNGSGTCGVCLPDTRRCENAAVLTCAASGQWGPAEVCETNKPVCSQGACTGVVDLAVGASHACARFDDDNVRCWGNALLGRLGEAGLASSQVPAWATGFSSVSFGRRHHCGIRADGTVWCWGAGDHGQLGHGAHTSSLAPVATGVRATAVAVGDDHSCAIVTGGSVQCWGRNDLGQLGSGKAPAAPLPSGRIEPPWKAQPSPQLISGLTDATALSLDDTHTCVVRKSGETRCWGLRALPIPPAIDPADAPAVAPEVLRATMAKATTVVGASDAVALGCGMNHCCALTKAGTVSCWGAGDRGALGTGDVNNSFQAVSVGGVSGATSLHVGRHFACALLAGGSVACWGRNDRGQLGTGSDKPFEEAQVIATLGAVRTLSVGDEHACALLETGALMCWGDNRAGQLGQSGAAMRNQPVPLPW